MPLWPNSCFYRFLFQFPWVATSRSSTGHVGRSRCRRMDTWPESASRHYVASWHRKWLTGSEEKDVCWLYFAPGRLKAIISILIYFIGKICENDAWWCLEDRRTTFLWGGHLFRVYVSFRGATLPSLFISDVLDDSFDVHLVMRSSAASAWRCNCVVSSAPVLRPFIILYTISARQCRWFKQRNFISVHGYEFGIRIAPYCLKKSHKAMASRSFEFHSHQLILN